MCKFNMLCMYELCYVWAQKWLKFVLVLKKTSYIVIVEHRQ